MSETDTVGYC